MVDILHRVGAKAPRAAVYDALTTRDGLAAWWTTDTTGDAGPGGVLRFRFLPGGFDMKVVDLVADDRVEWEVIDGPEEWIGTRIVFELSTAAEHTIVRFTHAGWREASEFTHHCSTKWATFLLSLKALVETGSGAPAPNDLQVSDWH